MFGFELQLMFEELFGMNVDTVFNGDTVQWDGRYNIEEGHLDDLEEDDTVDKCVHRDGDEKPDVLKVFFDYYEGGGTSYAWP